MLQHWLKKFSNAFRGIYFGIVGQSSFHVHVPLAAIVLLLAWTLRCETWQWCILALCIALVLSLELVNSSIEMLARGLCREHNPQVGQALDIASAAVLIASLFSAILGVLIFGSRLLQFFQAE